MSASPLWRSLDALSIADLPEVGGKALGCARLAQMGLPVPRGIVLTTTAFHEHLRGAELGPRRRNLLARFAEEGARPEALQSECAELELAIREASLPTGIAAALEEALAPFQGALAVRSSALAEDGADTSFAGVFTSTLDVDRESLASAVARCWASACSYSAFHHALSHGIDPSQLSMGVVIQEMVKAERAGVVFSRDPSGAGIDCAVVAESEGTAEALMDGETAGDAVTLPRKGKGVGDSIHRALLRAARRAEKKLGHPQDLEWAARGDKLYFLQSRPISTMELAPGKQIVWTRELTEERYPQPISPLGWSALQGVLEVNLETLARRFGLVARDRTHVARTIRHHVYTNERFFSIPGSLRPNPLAHLRFLPGYARHGLAGLLWDWPRSISGPLGGKWALYRRLYEAAIFPHAREIEVFWRENLQALIAEMDAVADRSLSGLRDEELFAAHREIETLAKRYMEPDLAIYVVKSACEWLVAKLGVELTGDGSVFLTDLTGGLEGNCTLEMNEELAALGDALNADSVVRAHLRAEDYEGVLGALDGEAATLFDDFVARNGHLTTNWDLREATWGEDPVKILQMLRGHAIGSERRDFAKTQEALRARRQSARESAREKLKRARWFAPFFDELVDTLHRFMLIDEEHHFYCSRLFRPLRALIGELGKRLASRQLIDEPQDVYFLELGEIRSALLQRGVCTRRYLVGNRKTSFERAGLARPPNRYRDHAPIIDERPLLSGSGDLPGTGASPGVASGRVKIVESPSDVSSFAPGEVLVTPSPNPAWTPIYSVASALVTSTGSILSHGLVSAREYSLPAVIGVEDVTRRLQNGQRVTVNGDLGIVSIEAE